MRAGSLARRLGRELVFPNLRIRATKERKRPSNVRETQGKRWLRGLRFDGSAKCVELIEEQTERS